MKMRAEINEKINELLEKLQNTNDSVKEEALCNQIDALLWVISDASGKPI